LVVPQAGEALYVLHAFQKNQRLAFSRPIVWQTPNTITDKGRTDENPKTKKKTKTADHHRFRPD
jgi:hypothetical protein